MKQAIARKHIRFYNIDGVKLAREVGMGNRINTVMQSAFFKLAEIIPAEEAIGYMKAAAKKSYMKKGEDVVNKNYAAIDIGVTGLEEVKYPEAWANATEGAVAMDVSDDPYFVDFIKPILAQEGDKLPVSKLAPDGFVPTGTTKYEKRGIAVEVPPDSRELYPVQPLLPRLPPCLHPSLRYGKRHRGSRRIQDHQGNRRRRRQGIPRSGQPL